MPKSVPAPQAPAPTTSSRLLPIDIARGIALLGMMTVHVSIGNAESNPSRTLSRVLDAPSGRAAVLFFTLSGLSLALIAKQHRRSAQPSVLLRRGAALVLVGLVMATTFWGSTILHYYGVLFLLAPWLLRARQRTLLAIAAVALTLGSAATTFEGWLSEQAFRLPGVSNWLASQTISMTLGLYALSAWIGFFCVGLLLGRLDLDRRRVAASIAVIGAMTTVGVTLAADALPGTGRGESWFVDSDSSFASSSASSTPSGSDAPTAAPEDVAATASAAGIDPEVFTEMKQLYAEQQFYESKSFVEKSESGSTPLPSLTWRGLNDLNAHSNKTPWALQSLGIATTIIGALLITGRRLQRVLWPLAALGSISASAYVIHTVLVQDVWHWLGADSESVSVTRQMVTLVGLHVTLILIAVLIRWRWRRGPMEWLLQWLADPNTRSQPPAAQSAHG